MLCLGFGRARFGLRLGRLDLVDPRVLPLGFADTVVLVLPRLAARQRIGEPVAWRFAVWLGRHGHLLFTLDGANRTTDRQQTGCPVEDASDACILLAFLSSLPAPRE
jgi:hypothetical protein